MNNNSALILVQNERTAGGKYDHWQDATGERYQYPNQYKNKIREGKRFIYYKGTRREGGKRATPEYFGHGVIGATYLDPTNDLTKPKNQWKWICEIAEYYPFESIVEFKKDGIPYETIAQNQWSVAVREISDETYQSILIEAGIKAGFPNEIHLPNKTSPPIMKVVADLLVDVDFEANASALEISLLSGFAKKIGDLGESFVLEFLEKTLPNQEKQSLRWVAQDGEKPGYDIEYISLGGEKHAIEVKTTTGKQFPSIQITANEWMAAQQMQERYTIVLVADILGKNPKIEMVNNIASLVDSGELQKKPTTYRLSKSATLPG